MSEYTLEQEWIKDGARQSFISWLARRVDEQARQLQDAKVLISSVAFGSWAPDRVRPEYRGWMYANAPEMQEQKSAP